MLRALTGPGDVFLEGKSLRTPVLGPSEFPRESVVFYHWLSLKTQIFTVCGRPQFTLSGGTGAVYTKPDAALRGCTKLAFSWTLLLGPNGNANFHTSGLSVSPSSSGTSRKLCLAPECTHDLSFHLYKC